ncbi:unnamed protein product [Soboliphyme baturini]|uniref:Deoxyribodipyrimidine photo-lyase n=1 Tax=Soboliphyme baturini TaxID=241478 RepID=A0A183IK16_9BILA|nr:unnamed protein product [Soboliphyme baturini]
MVDGRFAVDLSLVNVLNSQPVNSTGKFVLYWVQAAPRVAYNAALEMACSLANVHKVPLFAVFVLSAGYPSANARHYTFLLEGLRQFQQKLKEERRLRLDVLQGVASEVIPELAKNCCEMVVDMGYTRIQREWYTKVAAKISCRLTQVETNVVVPVKVASDKEEFAARTIRPKLWNVAKKYLIEFPTIMPNIISLDEQIWATTSSVVDLSQELTNIIDHMKVSFEVAPVINIHGGHIAAVEMLEKFVDSRLKNYEKDRNIPGTAAQSFLSPYLHFGHLSPVEAILRVKRSQAPAAPKNAFIEELFVRRELAVNFVYYNDSYDSIKCLPAWATETLKIHEKDKRPYVYSSEQLENAQTHDIYWNACQLEMVHTGKMHGYMRMYWGKKVLEWSSTVDAAYNWILNMNDKYELDGRDPNGFAGVAWIFGKHDRPHGERAIFGKVRYMNEEGLRRKFRGSLEKYVSTCYALAGKATGIKQYMR